MRSVIEIAACLLALPLAAPAGEVAAAREDGAPASELAAAHEPAPPPARLSEVGFFVAGSTSEIRPQLVPFSPQYPLWSDGTAKRRWIELPPGTAVDASDPSAWRFPTGTRLFKEFSFGPRRVETRMIERLADGSWRYATYVWDEHGTDASLAPEHGLPRLAVAEAPGGRYAVPSEYDCRACHEGAAVPVLGFSALQLSPDRDPLAPHADAHNAADLRELVARGVLRGLPQALLESAPRIAAASPIERAALGYLHGNCGHCHGSPSETEASVPVGVRLAQDAAAPEQSTAAVLESLIGAPSRFRPAVAEGSVHVVVPGRADASVLPLRMRSRDPLVQMPPLGTAVPDLEGLALIERWIEEHAPLQSPRRSEEP